MRLNNWLRITVGGLALCAVLVVALAIAVWMLLRQSLPQLDGELGVPGLHTPVTVERDDAGVPIIRAGDRLSAAFALGFVHAQDRFFPDGFAQAQRVRGTGGVGGRCGVAAGPPAPVVFAAPTGCRTLATAAHRPAADPA
ncbi:penicillin acylase family protein [Dickeya solani]|uniref:penicillin acylase family protein n=1 Tax=Dickeya solani TaxID=1089444 RepID=UPI001FCC6924|nr:penicillin acylase family protein [Dickeya solani]